MRKITLWALAAAFAAGLAGCSMLTGRDDGSADFEKETSADEARVREDKARSDLGRLEASIADYYKMEKKIPVRLDVLIPKYLAAIPPLDLPACGGESEKVQYYPAEVLRGGQVDGSRIRGSGRWGYVFNDRQVIVFVDCLKPSSQGVPWYQVRGVY